MSAFVMSDAPPQSAPPKYQRVFDQLRQEILSGKYKAGAKLPSEAELVKRTGASRITVGRAVRELQNAGLVERRAGSGTYVRASKAEGGLSFGLLIPDLGKTEIFEPICHGMADAPEGSEHALLWANAASRDPDSSKQDQTLQLCQHYIARGVAGVFFAPLEQLGHEDRTNYRIIAELEKARIPVVLLDRDYLPYPHRSRHDLVGIDNRRTGFTATEHLLKLGCRRVVFLSFPGMPSTVDERVAGFREALFMAGIPIGPELAQHLKSDDTGKVREILESLHPDGFVCANDRTAGRLMHSLISLGVQVPGQIRIVGIDDIAYASLLPVPLTTMHQPCREIGMAAMSMMMERLRRPDMPVRDVLLESRLVIRDSCGARALHKQDGEGSR